MQQKTYINERNKINKMKKHYFWTKYTNVGGANILWRKRDVEDKHTLEETGAV